MSVDVYCLVAFAIADYLRLQTTYMSPPEGYTFLPVGTPDLADLCKILSKERDLPVSVVNVGYHLRTEAANFSCHWKVDRSLTPHRQNRRAESREIQPNCLIMCIV